MGISRLFDHPGIIDSFLVEEHQQNAHRSYYRLVVRFTDGSTLHAREYVSTDERNYSFHWQDGEARLISRWDNSPHHRDLPNLPHHRHFEGKVESCDEMFLETVLDIISEQLIST